MATNDADDLVPFQEVRVIRLTAPALLCRIGEKSVWRPPGFVWMTCVRRSDAFGRRCGDDAVPSP